MMKTLGIAEIEEVLRSGEFDSLVGVVEDGRIEAKGSPYQLASDRMKQELSKDVSALGNAGGGIILIGFETAKDSLSPVERITAMRPFSQSMIDTQQYRDVLQDWVSPPMHSVRIDWYESASETNKGVAAIVVPPEAADEKPYIVRRVVEQDGRVRGTLVGYYERVLDRVPETSAERLRGWLRDGMRFDTMSERLSTIEELVANLHRTTADSPSLGISDEVVGQRTAEAAVSAERAAAPIIVLTARSENQTTFPGLFRSRQDPVVRLLDDVLLFRPDGFGVGNHLSRPSEIVRGELRRRVSAGSQIMDVWQDGLLMAIGEGDYDLLCWWTRYPADPGIQQKSLIIRNFVLTEVTLNFLHFAIELFGQAHPSPHKLKFGICLDNMTINEQPCELYATPDRTTTNIFRLTHKTAPGPKIGNQVSTLFADIDLGRVAYELLAGLYVKFGIHTDEIPYVQRDNGKPRITPESAQLR